MKTKNRPFNRALSLAIDAAHVRITYVRSLPQTAAAQRRLKTLTAQLRKLERKARV